MKLDKRLEELLRIWGKLSEKGKADVLTHAQQVLVNQEIQRNRKPYNQPEPTPQSPWKRPQRR